MDFWVIICESNFMENPAIAIGFFCIDLFVKQGEEVTRGFRWVDLEE